MRHALAAYTVQSTHARIQYLGVVNTTPHTSHKENVVYKSRGFYSNAACVGACGSKNTDFYLRMASTQGWLLYKTTQSTSKECLKYVSRIMMISITGNKITSGHRTFSGRFWSMAGRFNLKRTKCPVKKYAFDCRIGLC